MNSQVNATVGDSKGIRNLVGLNFDIALIMLLGNAMHAPNTLNSSTMRFAGACLLLLLSMVTFVTSKSFLILIPPPRLHLLPKPLLGSYWSTAASSITVTHWLIFDDGPRSMRSYLHKMTP